MLKYLNAEVVFREIPDEISLAFNLTNCPCKCEGCHSPELWEDKGIILYRQGFPRDIKRKGITCVLFLGGDGHLFEIIEFAKIAKSQGLKFAWYSGRNNIPMNRLQYFDYIKVGPYIKELGGLDNPNTNQKLYKVVHNPESTGLYTLEDITYKLQK